MALLYHLRFFCVRGFMWRGIVYALAACLLWGLTFVVPQFMTGFTALEVALGRYSVYGLLSLAVFWRERRRGRCRYGSAVWAAAMVYALSCTIVYYLCLVLGLSYATPAVSALIAGSCPITIAFYDNWKRRECDYRRLLLPSVLVVGGLLLVNWRQLSEEGLTAEYLWGLLFNVMALACWTWYVVGNARFLKDNRVVSPGDWSVLLGVATLLWVALCGVAAALAAPQHLSLARFDAAAADWTTFVVGSAVLGFFCSWLGSYLWIKASLTLPVALAGQLMVFETVFGLLFVYAVAATLPSMLEVAGIVLLLGAVVCGHQAVGKQTPQDDPELLPT